MSQRFEGRNLEEALTEAAQTLGVERWQLTYHVVMEKRGFLGGMKRIVVEADVNADAPPPPAALPPLPRTDDEYREPRGERSGGGNRSQGRGRRRDGRGGGSRDGNRPGGRGGRGGGRGHGERTNRELRTGDFEQFMGEVPEQGSESEAAGLVREWCETVIFLARLDLVVRTEEDDSQILVRLYGRDSRRMTEEHGELMDAMQVLANKALVGRKVEKEIELDCEGFKEKRSDDLAQRAREAADRVRGGEDEVLLPSMSPIERRIVHITLQDDADVTTESRGEGFYKRVAIIPRTTAPAAEAQPSLEP